MTSDQVQAIGRFPDENPNPVLRVGIDGRMLYANPAAAAILEALGTGVGGSVPGEWLTSIRAAAARGADTEILARAAPRSRSGRSRSPSSGSSTSTEPTSRPSGPWSSSPTRTRTRYSGSTGTGACCTRTGRAPTSSRGSGVRSAERWTPDLLAALLEAVREGAEDSVEITSLGRDYALLPVDVPEYGFINIYGTDITADNEMRRLHRENQRLLLNILPEPVADRLRGGETLIADRFDDVTLLFADIVGFTAMSSAMSPHELVTVLNEVFTVFDDLVDAHNLEKVKTIGDAYMVIGGMHDDAPDHTERVADLALDLSARLDAIEAASRLGVRFRIGINCGPVVAGVIGTKKFIYDVWGDTVNLAARMESLGIPGRIQVSGAVEERLKDRYRLEARGLIEVKGKGSLPTWFLVGGPGGKRIRTGPARATQASQMPTGMRADDAGR